MRNYINRDKNKSYSKRRIQRIMRILGVKSIIMNMRIPFQISSKSMKDTNETRSKRLGFVFFVKTYEKTCFVIIVVLLIAYSGIIGSVLGCVRRALRLVSNVMFSFYIYKVIHQPCAKRQQ